MGLAAKMHYQPLSTVDSRPLVESSQGRIAAGSTPGFNEIQAEPTAMPHSRTERVTDCILRALSASEYGTANAVSHWKFAVLFAKHNGIRFSNAIDQPLPDGRYPLAVLLDKDDAASCALVCQHLAFGLYKVGPGSCKFFVNSWQGDTFYALRQKNLGGSFQNGKGILVGRDGSYLYGEFAEGQLEGKVQGYQKCTQEHFVGTYSKGTVEEGSFTRTDGTRLVGQATSEKCKLNSDSSLPFPVPRAGIQVQPAVRTVRGAPRSPSPVPARTPVPAVGLCCHDGKIAVLRAEIRTLQLRLTALEDASGAPSRRVRPSWPKTNI